MLKITTQVENLQGLNKYVKLINTLNDKEDFKNYYKKFVLNELDRIMERNFSSNTTTNDEYISLYKSSNHIEDIDNGFILYNDATILANAKDTSNYPNGQFSIALAFEYGVGVGEGTYDGKYFKPWGYNLNKYNFGWYYKDSYGDTQHTYGYMGYSIYGDLAFNINNKIDKIISGYLKKVGG